MFEPAVRTDVVVPPPLAQLTSLLDAKPEALAIGDEGVRLAALQAAKFVFDHGNVPHLFICTHCIYFEW